MPVRVLRVCNPNNIYKGQKPNIAVTINIAERIPKMIAAIPDNTPVIIRIANIIATRLRIILSVEPIFFFIFCGYQFFTNILKNKI